jgi:hypothetical protein
MKMFRRYWFLRARQVQRRLIPHDDDCAIARSILRRLCTDGWLRKHNPKMVDTLSGSHSAAPIYTITATGASMLATEMNDASYLIAAEPNFSQWMSLNHYCALSSLHMMIDDALGGKDYVKQTALHFEHEVVSREGQGGSRYLLHMTVNKTGEKPLFCCPDSAFETEVRTTKAIARRAWFTEFETGSDTPKRVFAKKHKGYEGIDLNGMWKRIFPASEDFRVLCFCPSESWMHALRKEFVKSKAAEFWRFCATPNVNVEKFLHDDVFFKADKGPAAFTPRPS